MDPIFQLVPEERRMTLLARRASGDGMPTYRFEIILQGAGETAFFNL
jgi:protocatechuate 3,4-dioxygenase alpha subunit